MTVEAIVDQECSGRKLGLQNFESKQIVATSFCYLSVAECQQSP